MRALIFAASAAALAVLAWSAFALTAMKCAVRAGGCAILGAALLAAVPALAAEPPAPDVTVRADDLATLARLAQHAPIEFGQATAAAGVIKRVNAALDTARKPPTPAP